ncbi:MAG TPA: bile acid:sodium symporter family protein [Chryseosolibacter sp.]
MLSLLLCATGVFLVYRNAVTLSSVFLISGLAIMAVSFQGYEKLRGFSYTFWILTGVTFSLYHPDYFTGIGDFSFKSLIVPLLQLIMFGVGTTMGYKDFEGVIRTPKAVIIGIVCQFTIMPLVGFTIAHTFNFPPEISAGIILIGCVPSGLASNVMSYIANANVALSITLTAIATLLAPVLTPFLMKMLAGQFVSVDFLSMMIDIMQIVILPICAGLVYNYFVGGKFAWLDRAMPVVSMVSIAVIITIITAAGRNSLLEVGPLLVLAVLIHNLTGFSLGYISGKLFRMDERSCRTIAIEVGLQNGGLASGLALQMGKVATVGLAPAIFGPLMNVTGSSLATWWRTKPTADAERKGAKNDSGTPAKSPMTL